MLKDAETVTGADFQRLSERAGYQYSQTGFQGEEPLFLGTVGLQTLSCGIELCSSDLVGLVTSEHEGLLDRSFTIAINLDDTPIRTEFGDNGELFLHPGSGAIVSTSDTIRMASRIESGMRSKSLLLRVKPERFGDDDLADEIYHSLKTTNVIDIEACVRTKSVAKELATPTIMGTAGRVLKESAALELLGRALLSKGAYSSAEVSFPSALDYAKLRIVRDLIETYPFENHSLTTLAKQAGMSLSALKSKFPKAFGQTVFAYISDIRLDHAYDFLSREGWPVSRVAHHVGFRHQSSFSAAFKKRFGVTPRSLIRR